MCKKNETMVSELVLLGFHNISKIKFVLFCLILLIYIITAVVNILIIILVSTNYLLYRPMYLFLSNLALADLITATSVVPNMLCIIWMDGHSMSIAGCFSQYFFVFVSTYAQCCLLLVMSFDRYLAICIPLRYSSIMNISISFQLIFWSWFIGIVLIKVEVILLCQLQFCTSNIIDHFFCDFAPILALSSTEVFVLTWLDFSFNIFVIFLPFLCINVSYICIFVVISKISSLSGKRKAFSTCSSHLIVVCIYYGSLIALYMSSTHGSPLYLDKFKSLTFVMITPFTNPIIYSLRNKDIKDAMKQFYKNWKTTVNAGHSK